MSPYSGGLTPYPSSASLAYSWTDSGSHTPAPSNHDNPFHDNGFADSFDQAPGNGAADHHSGGTGGGRSHAHSAQGSTERSLAGFQRGIWKANTNQQDFRNYFYLGFLLRVQVFADRALSIQAKQGARPKNSGGQGSFVGRVALGPTSGLIDRQSDGPMAPREASPKANTLCVGGPGTILVSLGPDDRLIPWIVSLAFPAPVQVFFKGANYGPEALKVQNLTYALNAKHARALAQRPRNHRPEAFFAKFMPEDSGLDTLFRAAREAHIIAPPPCEGTSNSAPSLGADFQVLPSELEVGESIRLFDLAKPYVYFSLNLRGPAMPYASASKALQLATFRVEASAKHAFTMEFTRRNEHRAGLTFELNRRLGCDVTLQAQAGVNSLTNRMPPDEMPRCTLSSSQTEKVVLTLAKENFSHAAAALEAGAAGVVAEKLDACLNEIGQPSYCSRLFAWIFDVASDLKTRVANGKAVKDLFASLKQINFGMDNAHISFFSENQRQRVSGDLPPLWQNVASTFGFNLGEAIADKSECKGIINSKKGPRELQVIIEKFARLTERVCKSLELSRGETFTTVRLEEKCDEKTNGQTGRHKQRAALLNEKLLVDHRHTFPPSLTGDDQTVAEIDIFLQSMQAITNSTNIPLLNDMPKLKRSGMSIDFKWATDAATLALLLTPDDEEIIAHGRTHGYSRNQIQALCWAVKQNVEDGNAAQLQRTLGHFVCSTRPELASTYRDEVGKSEALRRHGEPPEHTQPFLAPVVALCFLVDAARLANDERKIVPETQVPKFYTEVRFNHFPSVVNDASIKIEQSKRHYTRLKDKKERFLRRWDSALATLNECRDALDYLKMHYRNVANEAGEPDAWDAKMSEDPNTWELCDKMREVYVELGVDLDQISSQQRREIFEEILSQHDRAAKGYVQTVASVAVALSANGDARWLDSLMVERDDADAIIDAVDEELWNINGNRFLAQTMASFQDLIHYLETPTETDEFAQDASAQGDYNSELSESEA